MALSAASIMQSVSVAGLAGAAVHKLLQGSATADRELRLISHSRIFMIPIIFAIGTVALQIAPGIHLPPTSTLAIFLVGYAVGAYDVGHLLMMANGQFTKIALRRAAIVLAMAPLKFYSATEGNLHWSMVIMATEAAMWNVVLLPHVRILRSFMRHLNAELRDALGQTWKLRSLWLSGIVSALAQRVDLFVVSILLGAAAVGQYSTASRPIEATVIIATSMISVLFNPIVKSSSNAVAYATEATRAIRIICGTAFLIIILMVTVGPQLILVLYGHDFRQAASILPIYAVSIAFLFVRQLVSRVLIIEHMHALSLISNLITIVANVLLNILFIPIFGIIGAALAAALTQPVSFALAFMSNKKGRHLLALMFVGTVGKSKYANKHSHYLIQHRKGAD